LPEIDIVTVNHALAEMHENAVKLIFSRLYTQWGDDPKKIVIADSLGYDYFKRKDRMFNAIQELGFSSARPQAGVYVWFPNANEARRQLTQAKSRPSIWKQAITRLFSRTIMKLLRTSFGRRLAKLIGRGLLKKSERTTELSLPVRNLRTFLDELVPGELTPDESFLKHLGQKTF